MGKVIKQLGAIEKHLHKQEIIDLAKESAQVIIDDGKYDLLQVYVELKRYETYLKGVIEHLKNSAFQKAAQIGQKSFNYSNAKVNIATRTKWDFSIDLQWKELDGKIQQLTNERKEREKYLKDNNKVQTVVDNETGEVIEALELRKEVNYGINITL